MDVDVNVEYLGRQVRSRPEDAARIIASCVLMISAAEVHECCILEWNQIIIIHHQPKSVSHDGVLSSFTMSSHLVGSA